MEKRNFRFKYWQNSKKYRRRYDLFKGKARALRPDKQRNLDENGNPTKFMSGAAGMLPTCFDVQPVAKKKQIAQSEKPVELYVQIIEFLTKPNELILDQFAGSGVTGEAAIKTGRKAILVEIDKDKIKNIAKRIASVIDVIEYSATPAPAQVNPAI